MATVSLTVPDAQLTRVVNALCDSAGVARSAANARAVLAAFIKRTVKDVEAAAAVQAARAQAESGFVDPGVTG